MILSKLLTRLMLLSSVLLAGATHAGDAADHSHAPLLVRSRPVIERIPLSVIDPVDVTVTQFGDTLVADRAGKILFRVDSSGTASVLAKDLDGVCRVTDSPRLGTHVLLSQEQSGRVLRITDSGFQSEIAHLPFAPAGLGVDSNGNLLTANAATGEIFTINPERERTRLAKMSEPVRDLVVDQVGNVVVLLKSGKLVAVYSADNTKPVGFVPGNATRLTMHPKDFVLALANDADQRPMLVRPTSDREHVSRFAGTPRGTSAFAFDKLGNLTLANPDLRAITRVTSHFRVPCPHCGKLVSMELSADAPPAEPKLQRSF
ncbi:hypothetical protein [Fuerstiella marisgermanici]|uniref:Uncharacterized protein n=1 Tax=Fuerstiella marisgermanici TaxID=1891926 RepID=A0A1P8WM08_9PLAN|nr:hypothetical protein [Fuerstiella marisgermanici]APZ95086.1 hypothetical protein Fuma_04740 [Fuerstiella marisgermanici]